MKCPKCAVRIELIAAQEPDADRWFVQSGDGQQHGPVSKEKLDALLAAGRLDGFCRVRAEDSDDWQWAEDLYPELASTAGSDADNEDLAPPEPKPSKPEPRVVRCPDCGKTVSTRADQCPHCGCPTSRLQTAPLLEDSSAAPVPVKEKRSLAKPLLIAGLSTVVVLVCIGGAAVWWAMNKVEQVLDPMESIVAELIPEEVVVELPKPPPNESPTLEELRAYAREVSEAMAKKVDGYYRQAHMATSLISSTAETSKMIQALAGGDLDAIPDSAPAAKPYESQYKSLFMECAKYLGDNIRADEKDSSKILEVAEKWAAAKQAAFDKQLVKQIGLE